MNEQAAKQAVGLPRERVDREYSGEASGRETGVQAQMTGADQHCGLIDHGGSPTSCYAVHDLDGNCPREMERQQRTGHSSCRHTVHGATSKMKDQLVGAGQERERDSGQKRNGHHPYVVGAAEGAVEEGHSYCCPYSSSSLGLVDPTGYRQPTGWGSGAHSWGLVGLTCRGPRLSVETVVGPGNRSRAALYHRSYHFPTRSPCRPSGEMAAHPCEHPYQNRNDPNACGDRGDRLDPCPVVALAIPCEEAGRDLVHSAGARVALSNHQ